MTNRTGRFAEIEITSEVECGSGRHFHQVGPAHYAFLIPSDPHPLHGDYKWYFCVRVRNVRDEPQAVCLDALRNDYLKDPGQWTARGAPAFISRDGQQWSPLDAAVVESNDVFEFRLRLTLAPGETVYVANSLMYPAEKMAAWLQAQAAAHPGICTLKRIGPSAQQRDILLLRITDPATPDESKDRVLVTSGLHPAEPDWLATTSIIEYLLGPGDNARAARSRYIFEIIPQVNPDGVGLGTNGCNVRGVNQYWDFRPHDKAASPETFHLWQWIEQHPPSLYLDFHCYVHNLTKEYQPYIKPLTDYHNRTVRGIAAQIDRRLIALCGGRSLQGPLTNLPSTLAYQITARYDTLTYTKFHMHLKHGLEHCRKLGLDVLLEALAVLDEHGPIAPYMKFRRSLPQRLLDQAARYAVLARGRARLIAARR